MIPAYLLIFAGLFQTTIPCLHKNEKRFHQNAPIKNQHLRDSLRRYETLHNRCHSFGIVEDLMRPLTSESDINCKYIYVFIDVSGLGNRIMTILSYFLLAMLTDRVLLLQSHEYKLNDVFCQPFEGSDWIVPDTISPDQIQKIEMPVSNLKLYMHQAQNFELWVSEGLNNITSVGKAQILYISGGEQYFIPTLFLNPLFIDRLNQWFPDYDVATPLIRYLLHPQDPIWLDIVESYTNRDMSRMSVGFHMRWQNAHVTADCVEDIPEVADLFVSSLRHYGDEPWLHHSKNWTVYQKYYPALEIHNQDQVSTVVHDMWLLSLTDKIVISPTSTFSYVIQALRGHPLLMFFHADGINRHAHGEKEPPICKMMVSHEPCFHMGGRFIFKYVNETIDHRFMRCEDGNNDIEKVVGKDDRSGVKLIVMSDSHARKAY